MGSNYDVDYSGYSIRGDQDMDTTAIEDYSTVLDGETTRNRDAWNDVTYAEYSKIITLQTRKSRVRSAHISCVCLSVWSVSASR